MWRSDKPTLPDYPATMPNVIADIVRQYGDREFLVESSRRFTYADVDRMSSHLARGYVAAGIGKGTRVGIVMPNASDWVINWWALSRIGALTISLSTFFQSRELAWSLKEADIDTLLIVGEYAHHDYIERLERAIPDLASQQSPRLILKSHPYLRRIVVWGDCDRPWATQGPDALLAMADAEPAFDAEFLKQIEANVSPADEMIGICTSGSTAEPKIVIHTHASAIGLTYTFRKYVRIAMDDRNYCGMPFFWIGGLNVNLMPVMYEGACMVFSDTPAVDDVLKAMSSEKVTRVSMWPAQLAPVVEKALASNTDLSSVRRGLLPPADQSGNPIPLSRRATAILGMTESFGMHGGGWADMVLPEGKGGCWGYEIEGIERKIIDPATGKELPLGQVGELYIRGFTLMRGYYKREWRDVFQPDAFFATGDLCRIDEDGYIWFTGRGTEMVKTAGANVAPREVEMLMMTYPVVLEAIVFGLPDPLKGENLVAVVIPRDGATIDSDQLLTRMRQDISAYKVPKQIVVMNYGDIPRTDAGKPRKPVLRGLVAERLGVVLQG